MEVINEIIDCINNYPKTCRELRYVHYKAVSLLEDFNSVMELRRKKGLIPESYSNALSELIKDYVMLNDNTNDYLIMAHEYELLDLKNPSVINSRSDVMLYKDMINQLGLIDLSINNLVFQCFNRITKVIYDCESMELKDALGELLIKSFQDDYECLST